MESMRSALWRAGVVLCCLALHSQVIEFESNGLRYKTLTRNSFTVMFAPLTSHVKEYSIIQVALSNGSKVSWTVRPEEFRYLHEDGTITPGAPALTVVESLLQHSSRHDVIKLVATYEASIYGNSRLESTNGYEERRRSALAEVSSARIKAAAAASAIAFVTTKLAPGQSTDGAVFFPNHGHPIGPGHLLLHAAGEDFDLPCDGEPGGK